MVSAVVLETTGVVSADFKQSEVGPIPLDWRVAPLREFLQCAPRYGVNAPAIPFDPSYPAYIRITDITEDGRFDPEARTSVKHSLASQYQLRCGDIVLARTGASTGKSYLYRPADGELVYAGFLIKICPDQSRLSSRFVRFWLQTPNYWSWVRANSMRSGQPGINAQQYASLPLPIPPTLAEQEAIADALEDADALIESLEQLIAKKRAVKQGAMQNLLCGRRRLPGFTSKWTIKRLEEISDIRSGGTPSTTNPAFWDGTIPWCTPTDITALNGSKYILQTARNISEVGLAKSSAELIPKNSVIMTTRATIGECAINKIAVTTNQGFKNLIPHPETNCEFLYYLMKMQRERLIALCGGSTFLEIGKRQLAKLEVALPDDPMEQEAIGMTLADMDAELDALELRLQKARQIKQGMMQELLTGRVRLV